MSGSTARSDLVGPGIAIDAGRAPGFPQARATFLVDGAEVTPRVFAHRWDPDFTETVYALTDALRLIERKGVRGDVLCADWHYEGAGRVEVHGAPAGGLRVPLRDGAPGGELSQRPFAAWLARHAPRLHTDSRPLAERYAQRWFVVYRDGPGPLPLQLRELRWMREPAGVEAKLARWDGSGDPYTPAIEFGEHHQVSLAALRDRALGVVVARGGFDALPARLEEAVWHWGMVRSLGGPDLRDAFARAFPGFTSPLPFLLGDFERTALLAFQPRDDTETSWLLHALGRLKLADPYARVWSHWAPREAFDSAWLDTFFRGVLIDGLVSLGPMRVDGVPWKDDEISLERDAPGEPVRVSGSRRSSQPR